MTQTLKVLAILALQSAARAATRTRPCGVRIPEDAGVTFTPGKWAFRNHLLVMEDRDVPVWVSPISTRTRTLKGVTVAVTLDNNDDGTDKSHVYVLLNARKDLRVLHGRDDEGYRF